MGIEESNRLIAEFMGKEIYQNYHESHYHNSWDWLMPVVEKIEGDERFDVDILQNGTRVVDYSVSPDPIVCNVADISFENKIDHTYDCVVKFIQWYNQNKE